MDRIRFINHKGKLILFMDMSRSEPAENVKFIQEAKRLIATQTKNSVLILTDVTEARYDLKVAEAIKDFVRHNTPYVKASAVIGVSGIQKIVLQAAEKVSGRNLVVFNDIQTAKDWLLTQ